MSNQNILLIILLFLLLCSVRTEGQMIATGIVFKKKSDCGKFEEAVAFDYRAIKDTTGATRKQLYDAFKEYMKKQYPDAADLSISAETAKYGAAIMTQSSIVGWGPNCSKKLYYVGFGDTQLIAEERAKRVMKYACDGPCPILKIIWLIPE